MANPQPDRFTRISNELYEAIMTTDFSKRQRKILDLVLRLSYGCGKKDALIKPSDFELVGVRKGHIKQELKFLSQSRVLIVNGEQIGINKNYDEWRVSLVSCFDKDKFKELIKINLDHRVTVSVTSNTRELPKQELSSYQNSNRVVTKTVTDTPLEASDTNGFHDLKEIVKKSKDSITTTNDEMVENLSLEQEEAIRKISNYWLNKQQQLHLSSNDLKNIESLIIKEKIPSDTIIEGIEEVYKRFLDANKDKPWKKINSLNYCIGKILDLHHEKINPNPPNNVTPFRRSKKEDKIPLVVQKSKEQCVSDELTEEQQEKIKTLKEKLRSKKQAGGET